MLSDKNLELLIAITNAAEQGLHKELDNLLAPLSHEDAIKLVNYPGQDKETALHRAVDNGHLETVNILLAYEANPNAQGFFNETPLHRACSSNFIDIVKCLLKAGAKSNISATNAENPIHQASNNDAAEVVKILLDHDGTQLQIISKEGRTPFYHAAMNGSLAVLDLLLGFGVDINQANLYDNGKTALHLAAINNNAELADFLIKKNADLNKLDGGRLTPLQRCAVQSTISLETALKLIEANADINAGDPPPLHLLASHIDQSSPDLLQFAKSLIDHGCITDAIVNNRTALDILKEQKHELGNDELGLYNFLNLLYLHDLHVQPSLNKKAGK
jgi:ankyrin repeat protein